MNNYYDAHFARTIATIYPGEFFSTKGDELISTVLGSCISIAFYDTKNLFGGMNHFMLAYDNKGGGHDNGLQGRFGEYAVELLLNDMLKKGADRKSLTAKIFGGSNVFALPVSAGVQVGDVNIKFAFDYLKRESIPVVSSDTGGIEPRKIFFDPKTSKVWLKRIKQTMPDTDFIIKQEESYLKSINAKAEAAGDVVLFN